LRDAESSFEKRTTIFTNYCVCVLFRDRKIPSRLKSRGALSCSALVLPRVAVVAATLAFSRQILEN